MEKNLEDLRLDYGLHTIKVKGKATGYAESDFSASVQYNSQPRIIISGKTLTIRNISKTASGVKVYFDEIEVLSVDYAGAVELTGVLDIDLSELEVEDGEYSVYARVIEPTYFAQTNSVTFKAGSGGIYGVSWTNDESTTMERTDDAVGLTYAINSSSGEIASDFNDVFPWNVASVETVDGNKMKHMPGMWFRVDTDTNGDINAVAVSETAGNGDDWYYVPEFYYGCYGASANGDGLASVTGVSRNYVTRSSFRTKAAATGTGYQQLDLYHRIAMLFLWWIEWATKKSDSIMSGRISGSGTGGGSSVCATGGTDSVATESGFNPTTAQMKWHDIEDFVGNMLEWVDGISGSSSNKLYVCADSSKFSDTLGASGYSLTSYTTNATTSTYCIKAFGWDKNNPFLVYPTKTTGGTTYTVAFCDGVYLTNSSNPCVYVGAYYNYSSANFGVSYFHCNNASSSYSNIGGRLLKIPS
jgi:hypothetical protein